MKRILIIAIMLVAGAAAHCQAVYQYPYSGYMEIPIPHWELVRLDGIQEEYLRILCGKGILL